MAKTKKDKDEVIKGDTHGKDVVEQTKEARGEDKEGKQPKDKIDSRNKQAEDALYEAFPERRATDLRIAARADYLRERGITPGNEGMGDGGGLKKVEKADTKNKTYIGMVTVTGIHGQTHENISARIDLPIESGEDYVRYAFFCHHPAAIRDAETIKIDPNNEDDPNLRSRYE